MKLHSFMRLLVLVLLFALTSCGRPGGQAAQGVISYETRIVDSGDAIGRNPSLAFDSVGKPFISYYDWRSKSLKYAEFIGPEWAISTVEAGHEPDSGGGVVGISLAVDSTGRPHISYMDNSKGQLKYASRDAAGWRVRIADQGSVLDTGTSIKIDGEGTAHIAYFYVRNGAADPAGIIEAYPRYISYGGRAASQPETVDQSLAGKSFSGDAQALGLTTSLVLSRDGTPYVSYMDPFHHSLNIAERIPGGGWTVSVIAGAPEGNIGPCQSLAIDTQGRLYVSYTETEPSGSAPLSTSLKYAVFDGKAWHRETVDAVRGETKGEGNSLTLGPDFSPVISYTDTTWIDLKIAFLRSGRWEIFRLDTGGLSGVRTSIAPSPPGNVGVAYVQAPAGLIHSHGALKFSLVEF